MQLTGDWGKVREKLALERHAPIQIHGICSETGTDARNETLARERATQLKMFLTRYGGCAFGSIHEKAAPGLRLSSDYVDPAEGAEREYERAVLSPSRNPITPVFVPT